MRDGKKERTGEKERGHCRGLRGLAEAVRVTVEAFRVLLEAMRVRIEYISIFLEAVSAFDPVWQCCGTVTIYYGSGSDF